MRFSMPRLLPAGGTARAVVLLGGLVLVLPAGLLAAWLLWPAADTAPPASVSGAMPATRGGVAGRNNTADLERLRIEQANRGAADAMVHRQSYTPSMGGFGDRPGSSEPGDPGPPPARTVTLIVPEPVQAPAPPAVPARTFSDEDIGLALAMAKGKMGGLAGRAPAVNLYEAAARSGPQRPEGRADAAGGQPSTALAGGPTARPKRVLMDAGTTVYGTILIGGNTDQGSPTIVAEALSGPIKGRRLLGSFARQSSGNQPGALLNLHFSQMELGGGRVAPIDAFAVAPDTMDSAVASRIDPHTMERIVLPAAAAFVQGLGQAIALSGSFVSAGPYGGASAFRQFNPTQLLGIGAGAAGNATGRILQDQAPRSQTVYIDAGSEVGIVFRAPLAVED